MFFGCHVCSSGQARSPDLTDEGEIVLRKPRIDRKPNAVRRLSAGYR